MNTYVTIALFESGIRCWKSDIPYAKTIHYSFVIGPTVRELQRIQQEENFPKNCHIFTASILRTRLESSDSDKPDMCGDQKIVMSDFFRPKEEKKFHGGMGGTDLPSSSFESIKSHKTGIIRKPLIIPFHKYPVYPDPMTILDRRVEAVKIWQFFGKFSSFGSRCSSRSVGPITKL